MSKDPRKKELKKAWREQERQKLIDVTRIVPWLREHGGYCDCEVLANVEDEFSEILER
jgi:hypothetical protein